MHIARVYQLCALCFVDHPRHSAQDLKRTRQNVGRLWRDIQAEIRVMPCLLAVESQLSSWAGHLAVANIDVDYHLSRLSELSVSFVIQYLNLLQ